MNLPTALLSVFPPDSERLLDLARRQINDGMLDEMAAADYAIDTSSHLAALRVIRNDGILPNPMGWHPGEVLELIRWSDPENPAHKPGSTGLRGHQMRAFACAALLRSAAAGCEDSAEEATLAQCLATTKALGHELTAAAGSFLTWRIPSVTGTDRLLFGVGLIIVAARHRNDCVTESILAEAIAWLLAEEAETTDDLKQMLDPVNPMPAPFGLTYGFWAPLAAELKEISTSMQSVNLRESLELIAETILAGV